MILILLQSTTKGTEAPDKYRKNNPQIYDILNKYGNEGDALRIAENQFNNCIGQKNPSCMDSCSTIYKFVKSLKNLD